MKVAVVLWSGGFGGAERWSVALARALARRGIASGLVFVCAPEPLSSGLADLRWESMRLSRGAQVLGHARSLADLVGDVGADAAILPSSGYLSAALRTGGYQGGIIAVEHGGLLQLDRLHWAGRVIRHLDLASGLWVRQTIVAPSNFMRDELLRRFRLREVHRIYLGLDLSQYPVRGGERGVGSPPVVGCAARLIRGKGLDILLEALSDLDPAIAYRAEIAGDGPMRRSLERRAGALGVSERVRFRGWVGDMPSFWRGCDIAVVPSHEWIESFGMVVVEAMASGLPVVASRRGALPEVVAEGETGHLFEPGNVRDLSRALEAYLMDPGRSASEGRAGRERCSALFSSDRCAEAFEELLGDVA